MKNKEKWKKWRAYGKKKFVFFYALLWAICTVIVTMLMKGFLFDGFNFKLSLINVVAEFLARFPFFFIGGIFLALLTWRNNEKEYRKYI